MKGSCLRPIARGWQLGSALLLFAMAGQAWAAPVIYGKVTAALPSGMSFSGVGAKVFATNDKYEVSSADVHEDHTYSISLITFGTYTVAVRARGLSAPSIRNVVISSGHIAAMEDFDLKTAAPFPIVKSPHPISLDDGIDSAAFQDATEIDLNSGENVAVGDATAWGGPSTLSARFKVKYSSLGIHIAGDVTSPAQSVNNQTYGNIWNGDALEVAIQNDPFDITRTTYDNDHDWHFGLSLGSTPAWWLWGGLPGLPTINGKGEPVTSHFKIQNKSDHEQTFRVDIPWAILLDSSGKPISEPADNALGALDLALDAAGPTADRSTATRAFQLTWSRFEDTSKNPSSEVPVQFVPQAPATTAGP